MNKLIMNDSSDLQLGWKIAEELAKINKAYKRKVNFDKQDKTHALYLVLGGMTTFVIRALNAITYGHSEDLAQLQRIISESTDFAMFLCESPNESRQIRQWFNGKIVERKPGNKGNLREEERATLFKIDKDIIERIDMTIKTANDFLSIYFHPTYELITIAYDEPAKNFKYYGKHIKKFTEKEIKSLVRTSIHPALTAFGLSMNTMFPETITGDLEEGAGYLKTLSLFTRKLYPESFIT